ncbi:MAG: hypothetical protein WAV11_02860 [Minisyncoccia bacterium]
MKNIGSLILFLVFLFLPITFTYAYGGSLGTFGNPLQVEVVQTPSQILDQQRRDMELRSQQQSQQNSLNSALHLQQELKFLELKQQVNDRFKPFPGHLPTPNCQNGYVLMNGSCITYNQSCNLQYPNTVFVNYNGNGERVCNCASGYLWNKQKTGCILDYNLICSDKFGAGFTWDGTINSAGGPNCSSAVENNKICAKDYGERSIWNGKTNEKGGLICDCMTGYQWNSNQTSCITISKPKTISTTTVINGGRSLGICTNNATNYPTCDSNVKISCDKIVFGKMTSFGVITKDECSLAWKKAVEAKQQETKIEENIQKATTTDAQIISNSSSTVLVTSSLVQKNGGIWKVITGWFGF